MTTLDLLERAHARLTELRDQATQGPWIKFDASEDESGWWWVWAEERLPNYGGILDGDSGIGPGDRTPGGLIGASEISDGGRFERKDRDERNVDMIITLHRTIDAQLEILTEGIEDLRGWAPAGAHYAPTILARAILGEES
ncbi:hypothetical protein M2390_003134 [Mycetocola sp. BIGb0189]|uniref:hypothetical protein n=1 Tax=Mycetocola sp. BIGb0189 TaxID=2940604 RepID=UPI0021684F4C|nr:hypothetical protein [Mycetocola sp. BIGb0189]MCS4277918.1 hypothetical protein [Mycetocola sp. BIGb0189]